MSEAQRRAVATAEPQVAGPVDAIPENCLPYWRKVLDGVEQANKELTEAASMEQQVIRLRQSATARIGAYESYAQHLFTVLGLDERTDRIEPDGRVTRNGPSANGIA